MTYAYPTPEQIAEIIKKIKQSKSEISDTEFALIEELRKFKSASISAVVEATFKKRSGESLSLVHKRDASEPHGWWEIAP